MVKQLQEATKQTKKNIETAYEVLAIGAALAVAIKVADSPYVNNLPVWQIAAGIVIAGVAVKVFNLLKTQ